MNNEVQATYLKLIENIENRDSPFGLWMTGLWPPLPVLQKNYSFEELKRAFFDILERLLQDGHVVLSPPEEFWNVDEKRYDVPMRSTKNFIGIWDVPIKDQLDYMRKFFPENVVDPNDTDLNFFFYDRHCPRIGWVDPETGEIIGS